MHGWCTWPLVCLLLLLPLISSMMTPAASIVSRTTCKAIRRNLSTAAAVAPHDSIAPTWWVEAAKRHQREFVSTFYPPGDSLDRRQHAKNSHPIYNFLHRYYKCKVGDVIKYSPGFDVPMQLHGCEEQAVQYLHPDFLSVHPETKTAVYDRQRLRDKLSPDLKLGWIDLGHSLRTLEALNQRSPFYGCFGFHEWAMLYSGGEAARRGGPGQLKKHQGALPLRVSQETVDKVVESSSIRCTHFDAWRFFHPAAQPLNMVHPMTRSLQPQHDQPGCIHANMDLFKYALQLYPLASSGLLQRAWVIALRARKIDMRASPYDCSQFDECADGPILVETKEGRAQYVEEQQALYRAATPLREELLQLYRAVLTTPAPPAAR